MGFFFRRIFSLILPHQSTKYSTLLKLKLTSAKDVKACNAIVILTAKARLRKEPATQNST